MKARKRKLEKLALHAWNRADFYFQDSIYTAEQIGADAILALAYQDLRRLREG